MQQWIVSRTETGITLQQFLKVKLGPSTSMKGAKRLIDSNLCEHNGHVERFASTKLRLGDKIRFFQPKSKPTPVRPQLETARILFEDDVILIYDKPPAISCQGAKSLEELLQAYNPNLRLVHRLDRDTSGVILLAKDQKTEELLSNQFKTREIEKTYLAIVDGVPRADNGEICNYLGKLHSYDGQSIWGVMPNGRLAITLWRKERSWKNCSLIRCFPHTGRTHQIRVHMSGIGHPILGDHQYGGKFRSSQRPARHLLHAEAVGFIHPSNGKKLRIEAALPSDFQSIIEIL